jgi:hypothetical protein
VRRAEHECGSLLRGSKIVAIQNGELNFSKARELVRVATPQTEHRE